MSFDPEVIDGALGKGVYEKWESVHTQFDEEENRAWPLMESFSTFWWQSVGKRLQDDLALAQQIDEDYVELLFRASRGETYDKGRAKLFQTIYPLSVSVVQEVNNALDKLLMYRVASVVGATYLADLGRKAKAVMASLEKLEEKLKKAESKLHQSESQLVINIAIMGITMAMGPLGVIGRGGFAVAQILIDDYIGASTSNLATRSSQGNTLAGAGVSAYDDYLAETNKMKKVAGRAGAAFTVVGFLFDANEIWQGATDAIDAKKAMEKARKDHQALVDEIKRNKSSLDTLFSELKSLRREMDSGGGYNAVSLRTELEDEMKRAGYRRK
jgi:hypothetical protein